MSEKNPDQAIQAAKKTDIEEAPDKDRARAEGLQLVEKAKIALVGTNSGDGFPHIKAMLHLKHEGLKTFWFSTNTSSRRVQQIKKDNRACLYFVDEQSFRGLMLVGTMVVLQDPDSRKMLWMEGAEVYYPQGVNDPDYSVLCFTAQRGNYYHGLKNSDFEVE